MFEINPAQSKQSVLFHTRGGRPAAHSAVTAVWKPKSPAQPSHTHLFTAAVRNTTHSLHSGSSESPHNTLRQRERKGLLGKEWPPLCCGHKRLFTALRRERVRIVCVCLSTCAGGQELERRRLPPEAEVIRCCPPAAALCPQPRCLEGCGSGSVPRCCAFCRRRAACRAPCAPG